MADAEHLVDNYFLLEDPNDGHPGGHRAHPRGAGRTASGSGASSTGSTARPDGELVVIDYKTGRAPSPAFEQSKLTGVHIYALLCQEVLGRRPVEVRLLHLKEPPSSPPSPPSRRCGASGRKTLAVWSAIERACRDEDFRPEDRPAVPLLPLPGLLPGLRGRPVAGGRRPRRPSTRVRRECHSDDGSGT